MNFSIDRGRRVHDSAADGIVAAADGSDDGAAVAADVIAELAAHIRYGLWVVRTLRRAHRILG